jgi:hypothetical protein
MIKFKSLSILALLILGSFQGVNGQLKPRGPVSFEPIEEPSLCPPGYAQRLGWQQGSVDDYFKTGRPAMVYCPAPDRYRVNTVCCLPIKPF